MSLPFVGIGNEASKDLVNGLAFFGRGFAEYVVSGERMEAKVITQLQKVLLLCSFTRIHCCVSSFLPVGPSAHLEEHLSRLGHLACTHFDIMHFI